MDDGISTKDEIIQINDFSLCITCLSDGNQFPTDLKAAEGFFDETSWPLFGEIWPAALVLTEYLMTKGEIKGQILEVGCGLAIPSIYLASKGLDITASDGNRYSEYFLEKNSLKNNILKPKFLALDWRNDRPRAKYDLIIGSDVIYDRNHPEELAGFLAESLADEGQIIVCDPNRSLYQKLKIAMANLGFDCEQIEIRPKSEIGKNFKMLIFGRKSSESLGS